jgi:L-asparaginase II
MPYLPILEYTRGAIVEAQHLGAVAVADARGQLIAAYGDPQTVTFMRSSAKPFQALALVESGAAEAFGFTPREVAIACASHRGLDMHAETIRGLHAKIGVGEADLLCGAHPLEDPETMKRLILAGEEPTAIRHNCSGKHTGMLAAAMHNGWPIADYINPQHPLQQTILQAFAEVCGLGPGQVVVGVDGCSAPNFAVPLVNAAAAFARLADPSELPPARAQALRTIFAAMTSQPEMVSGPGGFDTELMRLRPGLVAKGGAEGYQGLGLAPGALGPGSPALGIALKVADGGARRGVTALAATETLRQLGALSDSDWAALQAMGFAPPQPQKNWRGRPVGEARAVFQIEKQAADQGDDP